MIKKNKYGLIADIGGTNARFALVDLDTSKPVEILAQRTLSTADFDTLTAAAQHYLQEIEFEKSTVHSGTFAVAGAIDGDWFEMTNNPWAFSIKAVSAELNFSSLHLINDFAAIAWSIPSLTQNEFVPVGDGESVAELPVAVLGPGTGLGVGGYILLEGQFIALQTEGGHANFAPQTIYETEILKMLLTKYEHVSWERIISGPGLENLYAAMTEVDGVEKEKLTAADITNAALRDQDEFCTKVLNQFCACLGTLAGDIALIMGAKGGVNIAGGIVPRFVDFFIDSPFRKRFEMKGRFADYNSGICTNLVVADQPGLLGAGAHQRAMWHKES